jgi:hypothetical protein
MPQRLQKSYCRDENQPDISPVELLNQNIINQARGAEFSGD